MMETDEPQINKRPTHESASAQLREIYNEMRNRQIKSILKAGVMRSDPYFVPDKKAIAIAEKMMALERIQAEGEQRGGSNYTEEMSSPDESVSSSFYSDEMKIEEEKIRIKSASAALSGNVTTDDRRCLAISAIVNDQATCTWTPAFHDLQRRLNEEFGDYGLTFCQQPPIVGGGQLHWTLMQLVGFPDYESSCITTSNSSDSSNNSEERKQEQSIFFSPEYLDCVQDSLIVGGLDTAIHIEYIGVIAVATGLLMVGVPSLDINEARDVLRSRLSYHNFPLKEPFVNDIVHSTLYRLAGGVQDGDVNNSATPSMPDDLHLRLLALAKEYESIHLGSVILSNFQIGPASWRVLKSEMEATPPLRTWNLPVLTSTENYHATVLTDGSRECYTVSGASGVNLAKELKQVLLSRQDSSNTNNDLELSNTSPNNDDNNSNNNSDTNSKETDAIISQEFYQMKNDIINMTNQIANTDIEVMTRDSSLFQMFSNNQETQNNNTTSTTDSSNIPLQENPSSHTLTGIGGAKLALELRKKLEEEQKLLDKLYYSDFY